jgi:hypothetical protein
VNVVSEEGTRAVMHDEVVDLLRAAEELGIYLYGVRAAVTDDAADEQTEESADEESDDDAEPEAAGDVPDLELATDDGDEA